MRPNCLNSSLRHYRLVGTTVVAACLLLLLTSAEIALAHTRVEVGPYVIVVGWLAEPAIVGERNALTVEISEDEVPVVGAEADLDSELQFGPESFRANLNPTETPGLYTVDIFPTVRGQYAVRLFGSLDDFDVDVEVEPEEVFPSSRIQFPEAMPDSRELEKEIATLESEVQSAGSMAMVAIGLAAIGLLIAIVSLIRNR